MNANLEEQYLFRLIRPEEIGQTAQIERICFPPNEICTEEQMRNRIMRSQDLFFVAEDRSSGKLAGFINALPTDEETFRDDFFKDMELFDPKGKNLMLLGLEVLPEHRMKGIARRLMEIVQDALRKRSGDAGIAVLTCKEEKVPMYRKMGFKDLGISGSDWGGSVWHEMVWRPAEDTNKR